MLYMSASARAKTNTLKTYQFNEPQAANIKHKQGQQVLKASRFDKKKKNEGRYLLAQNIVVPSSTQKNRNILNPIDLRQIDQNFEVYKDENFIQNYPYSFEKDQDVLSWMVGMIEQSPTGLALLTKAKNLGWMMVLDDLNQGGYQIEKDIRLISLDHFGFLPHALGRSIHYKNAVLINFIKALRQVWHEDSDYKYKTTHRADVILMIERARMADCETMAILAAWELRAAGYGEAWRYALGSDEGDMAMIFTRAMEKDPGGFYDGSVLTRTFCQWYGDLPRVAIHDHKVLENMDFILKCSNKFGDEPLRKTDIETLSTMPDRQVYLNGMGHTICTDPYFLSMNDLINETHLFQIAYDSKAVIMEGVPFRDKKLASLIFPNKKVKVSE